MDNMTPEDLAVMAGILLFLGIVVWIIFFCVKGQDNSKELIVRKATILEKSAQGTMNIEWYVVEFENGERMRLRSFQANTILISAGDVGMLSYKGQTIQAFQRI